MGYNNDPATSLENIKQVLKITEERLLAKLH
jgi:hypothetical protein